MIGFGTCRNTTFEAEGGELPYEAMKVSETIIPSQAGWNKGDSQKVCRLLITYNGTLDYDILVYPEFVLYSETICRFSRISITNVFNSIIP